MVNCDHELINTDVANEYIEEYQHLKPGINLPKSDSQWLTANEHFKFSLPFNVPTRTADLNSTINLRSSNSNLAEIRYVWRLLRNKFDTDTN